MRVTMLVRCLTMMRGGGETRHLAWARELTALGVDVHVITGVPLIGRARYGLPDISATLVRSPYTRDFVYRFQNRRGFGRLTRETLHVDEEWFCRMAWRRIATSPRQPDVVHAHALYQAARTRIGNAPVVINLPGEPNARYSADLARADALVADGWAAEHMPAKLGLRVERVTKGVDAQEFTPGGPNMRQRFGLEGKRVVVTVARLVPLKNVALLLRAVALLAPRVADAHLVVVGDGPESASLEKDAAALGIADRVTFVGSVAQGDTPAWYRTADVFALSSRFDNSPNAVLEAMATALPVVVTDVGGTREFVDAGHGGIIVPPDDAFELARALEFYLTDRHASRIAGSRNRERATAEFSWRVSAQRLLDVYRQTIAARRAA
jgi:glycosyltransferase involved in cell wall biosynthesis